MIELGDPDSSELWRRIASDDPDEAVETAQKVYGEYKKAPEVTRRRMFLETMERVYQGTDKIILDSKPGSGVVPYLNLNELTKSQSRKGGQ